MIEGQHVHERTGAAGSDATAGVERNWGKRKRRTYDQVSLCVQALRLEQLPGVVVTRGRSYCGASPKRIEVELAAVPC